MASYLLARLSSLMFAVAAYVCYPSILIVLSIDIVRRYLFNAPWTWSQEFATLLLFVALALSAPEAWLRGVHIRAEFLRANVSSKGRVWIERVVWLLLILSSIALAYQSWEDGKLMVLFNENSSELGLPHMWFSAILAVSAVVTGLVGIFGLITGFVADEAETAKVEIIE